MNPSPLLHIQGDAFRASAVTSVHCWPDQPCSFYVAQDKMCLRYAYPTPAERDLAQSALIAAWRDALMPPAAPTPDPSEPSSPSGEGGVGGGLEELPGVWRECADKFTCDNDALGNCYRFCATQLEGRLANIWEEEKSLARKWRNEGDLVEPHDHNSARTYKACAGELEEMMIGREA